MKKIIYILMTIGLFGNCNKDIQTIDITPNINHVSSSPVSMIAYEYEDDFNSNIFRTEYIADYNNPDTLKITKKFIVVALLDTTKMNFYIIKFSKGFIILDNEKNKLHQLTVNNNQIQSISSEVIESIPPLEFNYTGIRKFEYNSFHKLKSYYATTIPRGHNYGKNISWGMTNFLYTGNYVNSCNTFPTDTNISYFPYEDYSFTYDFTYSPITSLLNNSIHPYQINNFIIHRLEYHSNYFDYFLSLFLPNIYTIYNQSDNLLLNTIKTNGYDRVFLNKGTTNITTELSNNQIKEIIFTFNSDLNSNYNGYTKLLFEYNR